MDIPQPKAKPVPRGANLSLPPIQESAPAPRAENAPLPPVVPDRPVVPFKEPRLTPRQTISGEDLQRANEKGIREGSQKLTGRLFWWTGVWPAFRMLSELTKGQKVSPSGLLLMPASGAVGAAVEQLLSHPGAMDFFTRPTRAQIASIPLELRGNMPEVVAAARTRGIPISPLLAAYAASIQRNRTNQQQQQQPAQSQPQGAAQ